MIVFVIGVFTILNFTYMSDLMFSDKRMHAKQLQEIPCVQTHLNNSTDLSISTEIPDDSTLQNLSRIVKEGGQYKPKNCKATENVAIIIPYRNRENNLKVFLLHMHPFLQRQQIQYRIFIIESAGSERFNRGMLINIGFVEANKYSNFSCFIFHDVDSLPLSDLQQYRCGPNPIHLSSAVDLYGYNLPYTTYFGCVNAFTKEQFQRINGFANVYEGWGREDDDLYYRTQKAHYNISRPAISIGRYKSLGHKKAKTNYKNYKIFWKARKRWSKDGLNNLNYTVIRTELRPLYTLIYVQLGTPRRYV